MPLLFQPFFRAAVQADGWLLVQPGRATERLNSGAAMTSSISPRWSVRSQSLRRSEMAVRQRSTAGGCGPWPHGYVAGYRDLHVREPRPCAATLPGSLHIHRGGACSRPTRQSRARPTRARCRRGLSPHKRSIRDSAGTTLLEWRRRNASSRRCLAPPSGTATPATRTSRGPSIPNCIPVYTVQIRGAL